MELELSWRTRIKWDEVVEEDEDEEDEEEDEWKPGDEGRRMVYNKNNGF